MPQMLEFGLNLSMLMSGNYQPQFTQAAESMSRLQKNIQTLQSTSAKVTGFQKQQVTLNATREKLESARERVRRLREEYRKSDNPSESMRRQLSKAQKEAGQLGVKFSEQRKKLAELNGELRRSGVDTSKLADYQSKLSESIDKAQAAQDRLSNAQAKYASLRSRLLDWGNIKGDILAAGAMIKAFEKPVKIDMDFEQAMADVRAVLNPLEKEFQTLRSQALELGSTTQFTATQASQAQQVLARAGLDVPKVIETMPALLSMSAAEGMEISQAADIIVNTLQGLRLDTGYANILTDLYAYTSAHSNTNIAELGEAMKAAAPVAATINLPAESLMALLGSMTSAARGGEAGTAIAASLPRMYAPVKKARNAYAEIGVAYKTKSGGVVRPEVLLQNIADKTKGLGTADQLRIYEAIFGKNHLSAMSALMANIQGGTYKELHGGLVSQRDGASQKMVSLRTNTLKGDVTSLSSAWEGLMIRIGNAVEPINRFFTQTITKGIQGINNLIDRTGPLLNILADGVYIIGGFMIVAKIYKYANLAVNAIRAFLELRAAKAAVDSISAVSNGLNTASQSATLFGTSLSKALGIIGLIAFASYEIVTHWKEITEWATKAGEAVSNIDTSKITSAKAGTLQRNDTDYGVAVMTSTYMPPEIKPHAKGGIMTQPHIGLVAEAGPEAIVPLRDKTRGLAVLNQAAGIMGVSQAPEIITAPGVSYQEGDIHNDRKLDTRNFFTNNTRSTSQYISPVVNLTVNIDGNNSDSRITDRIKSAVTEALNEIFSREERLAYAL